MVSILSKVTRQQGHQIPGRLRGIRMYLACIVVRSISQRRTSSCEVISKANDKLRGIGQVSYHTA